MTPLQGLRFSPAGALAARPRLAIGLVRLLMIATLVTVFSASLALQVAFDTLRASNVGTTANIFVVRQLEVLLQQAVADERLARLATTPAGLAGASGQLRGAERAITSQLAALGTRKAGKDTLRQPAERLLAAVPLAIAALGRLVPDRPGVLPPIADGDDQAIMAVPMRLAEIVSRQDASLRASGIERIRGRESVGLAAALAALTLFVVLLGGSATRLIEGRQRLQAARRDATLKAQLLIGAVDHMRDAVAVFDADDRLILSNGRLGQIAGLSEELTVPFTPYGRIAAALAHAEPPLLARDGPTDDQPVVGEMRAGKRVLAVYRSSMPDGGHMLTISDVTERAAAEELISRARRMEVLGRLTGGVAHDFNNLLQALSANLEILSAEAATSGAGRLLDLAGEAIGAVERGKRLTRHLLAFARRQALASVSLDTEAMLVALNDLLKRTLGDTIEVRLTIQPGLWPVFADAAGLENALLNLALNARDAMPSGGIVAIEARNQPAGEHPASVRIAVVDQGVGMTDEQLARAVEPFYTTKDVGAGVGLGLSLVDGFARQSGGRFRLESELGRGTTAILELPRAETAPAAEPTAPPVIRRGHGEKILLVEDDPVVCRASREALEQLGYQVVEAADAASACRCLEDDAFAPDLLFTDVMMPGPVDVSDLARRARALFPALPILFHTGDVQARVLGSVVFDGRMRLIAKPWRLAEISSQIRSLLDHPAALALSDRT